MQKKIKEGTGDAGVVCGGSCSVRTFFEGAEKRVQHRKVILLVSALTLSMRSQSEWIKNNGPGFSGSEFVLKVVFTSWM